MKPDIKKKWLAALRSGNYEQEVGVLRAGDGEGFCCLGVLYDCTHKSGWRVDDHDCWLARGGDEILADSLLEEYGITCNEQNTLTQMNDTGKTFNEIADWIKENL